MHLDKIHLDTRYAKAKVAFWECAAGQADQILEEAGVPFESISATSESVSIKFSGRDKHSYLIEARLNLFRQSGESVGWYCLHLDENENVLDDYLVLS